MLRFILFHRAIFLNMQVFQYISCYGLSQPRCTGGRDRIQFQYISCYGLSGEYFMHRQDINRFQYISCYGLSFTKGSSTISIAISIHPMLRFIADLKICMILLKLISIHPMLRFIFPFCIPFDIVNHFNTSHVTVYLSARSGLWTKS